MSNTTECRGTIWLHASKLKFQHYKQRLQGNAMFVWVCVWATFWPAAVRIADQLGCGGRDAQIVREAVFGRRAQVVLALLPCNLASSLNKQDAEDKQTPHAISEEHLCGVNI